MGKAMEEELLRDMQKAVWDYDPEGASKLASEAIQRNISPLAVMEALIEAIRRIGEGFGKGEFFLPELVGAAAALAKATPIVEEAIRKSGTQRNSLGRVVIGTVFGDIHTIGKSLVASLLTAEGFEVHDLGINISTDSFLTAIRELAPDILAMSSLLTTTAPEAKKVIDRLRQEGMRNRVRIIVGGGAISAGFAEKIGADGYDATAPGAVRVARRLLGK